MLTLADVHDLATTLQASGETISANKIVEHRGGSKRDALKLMRLYRAETHEPPTTPGAAVAVLEPAMARQDVEKGLTPKQRRFVEEYLVDLNATQAALRAGYSGRTAREQASRMLTNVNIQAAITAAQVRRSQRTEITQDTVLRELAVLAQSDVTHYVIDDHGEVQLRPGAPEGAMRAVSSLKKKITHTDAGVSYETTLTLWNKPSAVRMAGEHTGLFTGREQPPPDIHVHVTEARSRLADRLDHLASRHAEDATNGQ